MDRRVIAYVVVVIVVIAGVSLFYYESQGKSAHTANYIIVKDDIGRNVTIPLPVTRVVSMDPSNTQMMYSIGAGNLLVADTSYDWWPENATKLPKVEMDNGTASVEEVVSFKPDLVLATTIQPMQIVDQLQNLSIPVVVLEPQNLSMIYSDMFLLGNITGHQVGAEKEVNSMKTTVAQIEKKIAPYQKPSVLYMLWPDPIYTVGPTSFINSIIQLAGGINIADNLSSPYPIISLEQVVASNPQVIIVDNDTGVSGLSYFTSGNESAVWKNISAVINDRILVFNVTESSEMNEPGPLTVNAIEFLAEFLIPQAFQ
jgi:iron complex transport system substrate-binding protein